MRLPLRTRLSPSVRTFVPVRAAYLSDFVGRMAAINPGRVFDTAPEHLVEDIAARLSSLALDGGQSP
jgi:hypothetical protein